MPIMNPSNLMDKKSASNIQSHQAKSGNDMGKGSASARVQSAAARNENMSHGNGKENVQGRNGNQNASQGSEMGQGRGK